MFFGLSTCCAPPEMTVTDPLNRGLDAKSSTNGKFFKDGLGRAHYIAAGVDCALGIIVSIIALLGHLYGFLPSDVSFSLIGAGVSYSVAVIMMLGGMRRHENARQHMDGTALQMGSEAMNNYMDHLRGNAS